jgi:hypothetical protein
VTAKINENGTNIKNKNIGDLCRGNNDFNLYRTKVTSAATQVKV